MMDRARGIITTVAGSRGTRGERASDVAERDPLRVRLPKISSTDYHGGRRLVPTDLASGSGDPVVLGRRAAEASG